MFQVRTLRTTVRGGIMTSSEAKDRWTTRYNNNNNNNIIVCTFFRKVSPLHVYKNRDGEGRASAAEDKTARRWSAINLLDIFIMDPRCLKDFLSALSGKGYGKEGGWVGLRSFPPPRPYLFKRTDVRARVTCFCKNPACYNHCARARPRLLRCQRHPENGTGGFLFFKCKHVSILLYDITIGNDRIIVLYFRNIATIMRAHTRT